jgi:hypothetical protein
VALLKVDRSDLRSVALAAAIPSAGSLTVAIGAEDGAPTAGFGMVSVSRGAWQSLRGGEIDARVECESVSALECAIGGCHQCMESPAMRLHEAGLSIISDFCPAAPGLCTRLCLVVHFQRVDHPIWLVGDKTVPSHFGEG